jgi:hypothetical protein
MRPEDEIGPELRDALDALRDADRGLEAPASVEMRLQSAFRKKQRKSRMEKAWPTMLAIAAGAVLAVALWFSRGATGRGVIKGTPPQITVVTPGPASSVERPVPATQQVVQTVASLPRVQRAHPEQAREITTDFFPLVDYAPPSDGAELMRVSLPAEAMRQVGLPVREDRLSDRVQADVVMSNGLATAIRFVKSTE